MMVPALPAIDRLSLAEQVGQMVVVRASGHLFDHEITYPAWEADRPTLHHYIADLGVGGVILRGGSGAEVGLKTQDLQNQAAIPLLIAADIEEGVGQRFTGATWFPPPMALAAIAAQDYRRALDYAEAMGSVTAAEALAMGVNWVLAPVVDVNNNPDNPVINVRAFGQTPALVSDLATAFLRGAQRHGVLTTAKHFPGHGDTALDSHLDLPCLAHSLERLGRIELPPFAAAIAAGVDTIMTAHLQISALDDRHPATLSAPTLTGLLRRQMGFQGLIVTDALVMGAITRRYGPYEAAILAIAAGADLLLMPPDPEGCIAAVVEAVKTGRLHGDQIGAALGRIWRAKQRVAYRLHSTAASPHAWEQIPPPALAIEDLAQPSSQHLATAILEASMVTQGKIEPAQASDPGHNLVIVDDVLACPCLDRLSPALVLPAQFSYHLKLIDHQGCQQWPQVHSLKPTLVQVLIRGNPFRGSAAVSSLFTSWIEALLAAGLLRGLVIYGSPYVLEVWRDRLASQVPYGFTYGQMNPAQALVLVRLGLVAEAAALPSARAFTD